METSSSTVASGSSVARNFTWAEDINRFNAGYDESTSRAKEGVGHTSVGAIVFNTEGKVLLVQRSATKNLLPNAWDIPGGTVDTKEETILHGVVRQLLARSALRAVHISRHAGSEAMLEDGNLDSVKYSFVVYVDGYDVKLNPKDHQKFLWATEQAVRDKRCGDARIEFTTTWQHQVILSAFTMRNEESKKAEKPS